GDPRADHGGRGAFRPGAPARCQRAVRADHPERTVRADRWRAHDAGAGGSRAARAAAGFSRCAGRGHRGRAAGEGVVAMKIKANGININYEVDGPEGAPWLPFSNSHATNLTRWDEQANELKQRYRVLRYDQRGHGSTDAPAGRYSFATLLDDVVALMDALGIKKAHFAGLSMGGATALGLAETRPERLDRVIVCDSPCQSTPTSTQQWEERIVGAQKHGIEALVEALAEPTVARWFPRETVEPNPPHIDKVRRMIRGTPVNGFIGCAAALADHDYAAAVATVTRPVLFMAGEKDGVTPVAMRKLCT